MRIWTLLVVVFFVIGIAGCHTCEKSDDFGKCQECKSCQRPIVAHNWKFGPDTNPTSEMRPVDTERLEQVDQVFLWSEVYPSLQNLQAVYVPRLQNSPKWCEAYSSCQITHQEWEQYWKTIVNTGAKFLKMKEVMAKRLGHLLSQEGLKDGDRQQMIAAIHHLRKAMEIHPSDTARALEALDNGKILPAAINKPALEQGNQAFLDAAKTAEVESLGATELGSEELLNQLKNAVAELEKISIKN